MPVLAALDIGSNAMRLAVASVEADRSVTVLDVVREPVRLGQDVFTSGVVSEQTLEAATAAFIRFRQVIDAHGARWIRAVATSAMREALNREIVQDRIRQAAAIDIDVIGSEEEARLIHLAVRSRLALDDRIAVLVDIGGGSTEITLADGSGILSTESYKMGSVRLLRTLGNGTGDEQRMTQLIQEYVDATRRRIVRELGGRKIDVCIATGGNLEALGDLRREVLKSDDDTVLPAEDLDELVKRLTSMTYQERVRDLRLRPDRADVIIPAAIIIQRILHTAGVRELRLPRVGLKDGLLLDMVEDLYGDRKVPRRDQIVAAALHLGRKYQFDEQHATTVARHAVQLFDRTHDLHRLGAEHRLFLETAALLHDIGGFVSVADHHKHSLYILQATPFVGLTREQVAVIANIARYHRKSMPKQQHDAYRALPSRDRVVVSKLAALLRIADAMDTEHGSKVAAFEIEHRKPRLTVRLVGEGDLLLEKWAMMKKADLFEDVYGVKFTVAD